MHSQARDRAVTALILGIAAAAWFGWGHVGAPDTWQIPLDVGSIAGLALAVAAGLYGWRRRRDPSAMNDPRVRRGYFLTVGAEVVAIAAGSWILGGTGHPDYLAAWILFVVGVHFVPLA